MVTRTLINLKFKQFIFIFMTQLSRKNSKKPSSQKIICILKVMLFMMHMFLQRYLCIILNVEKLGSLQDNKGMILFCHLCSSRLMGLSQSYALCFVIDTTGSMADDIDAAKQVAFNIIDSNAGTLQEPSQYILVPFNDPGTSTFMDIPHVAKESQQTKHIYKNLQVHVFLCPPKRIWTRDKDN